MIPIYTVLVVLALLAAFLLDKKLSTRLYAKDGFWNAMAVSLVFQLIFDNWAARIGFWDFNPDASSGWYAFIIPAENLAFGAALFWLVAIVFVRCSRQKG